MYFRADTLSPQWLSAGPEALAGGAREVESRADKAPLTEWLLEPHEARLEAQEQAGLRALLGSRWARAGCCTWAPTAW